MFFKISVLSEKQTDFFARLSVLVLSSWMIAKR